MSWQRAHYIIEYRAPCRHCNALQSTSTHSNTLQHTAAGYNTLQHTPTHYTETCAFSSRPICCCAVCCSVLQCVALCCSVVQCGAVRCSVLQCVAVCCNVLQCVAVSARSPTLNQTALSKTRSANRQIHGSYTLFVASLVTYTVCIHSKRPCIFKKGPTGRHLFQGLFQYLARKACYMSRFCIRKKSCVAMWSLRLSERP